MNLKTLVKLSNIVALVSILLLVYGFFVLFFRRSFRFQDISGKSFANICDERAWDFLSDGWLSDDKCDV